MFYKLHVFCISVTKSDVYFIAVAVNNRIVRSDITYEVTSNLKANTVYLINKQHLT
jgi:hypothetical protein